MADKWVSVAEACQIMQVSERTLYRKIKDDKIQSRMTEDGRREVSVSVPLSKEELAEGHLKLASDTVDNQLKIVATALGSTEMVSQRMQAELDFAKDELDRVREDGRAEVERLQKESCQQIDYIKTEVVRTRKFGILGWSIAGALVVAIVILGIWSAIRMTSLDGDLSKAKGTLTVERQKSEVLADNVEVKKQQLSALESELVILRARLSDTTLTLSDRLKELADVRKVNVELEEKQRSLATRPAVQPAFTPYKGMTVAEFLAVQNLRPESSKAAE